MYVISKDFAFSYSHVLHGLPDGHQCARLHGHNAVVRLTLAARDLDTRGFVVDYGDLRPFGQWLDEQFDHRHLNDVVSFQPTAENLARYAFETAAGFGWPVAEVAWSETPKSWATYRPDVLA